MSHPDVPPAPVPGPGPDQRVLGVDIGGSGIKAAPVDVRTGALVEERQRLVTPDPATPAAVAEVVAELVGAFAWTGPVGLTVPAVVQRGVVRTAANIDQAWIGTDAAALFGGRLGRQVVVVNDADAAGVAETRYGAARDVDGVVVMITLGTGIGSALFLDGQLVPNTELGHLEVDGHDAETRAAASVRDDKGLSWPRWGKRVGRYLRVLDALLWPDLIVVGGGVSRRFDRFSPYLDVRCPVVPAGLGNDAGIVGVAVMAAGLTSEEAPPP